MSLSEDSEVTIDEIVLIQHIPPGLRMTGLASPYPCDLENYESAEIDGMISYGDRQHRKRDSALALECLDPV
ncbi:hypothetical protein N7488_011667 [Penicillium malachiteum]|nr:hypothetical protein N7488_011667 [Penicillium malachiteum]